MRRPFLVMVVVAASSANAQAQTAAADPATVAAPPVVPAAVPAPTAEPLPPSESFAAPPSAPEPPAPLPQAGQLPPPRASSAEPEDRGYGRRHSTILSLSLGIANGTGGTRYGGGAGFAYFVVTGVAPGADVSVNGGGGTLTTAAATGTLRLVPVRAGPVAFFLIGRAGRLFIASHDDVWAAGGGAGVVIATGGPAGLQLSYEVLGLWPSSHCSDLVSGCRLDAFGLGLVMGF